jgi:hypothetical protein
MDSATLAAASGELAVDADRRAANVGRRMGVSSGRLPNFFIAPAASTTFSSSQSRCP